MPRVVADQKGKFETDELFVSISRPTEITYTGLVCGNEEERRRQFLRDCTERRLGVAFLPAGLNLELDLNLSDSHNSSGGDSLDFQSDPVKVFLCYRMILNGVCVRLKGWIDRITLRGSGSLEFDPGLAEVENQRLEMEASGVHCSSTGSGSMLVLQSPGASTVSGSSVCTTAPLSIHQTTPFIFSQSGGSLRPESNGGPDD